MDLVIDHSWGFIPVGSNTAIVKSNKTLEIIFSSKDIFGNYFWKPSEKSKLKSVLLYQNINKFEKLAKEKDKEKLWFYDRRPIYFLNTYDYEKIPEFNRGIIIRQKLPRDIIESEMKINGSISAEDCYESHYFLKKKTDYRLTDFMDVNDYYVNTNKPEEISRIILGINTLCMMDSIRQFSEFTTTGIFSNT